MFALVCGLGLPAGAVARAQGRDTVPVAKPDSVKKPAAIMPDSIKPDSVKRDTIKPGFTRSELPVTADIGRSYRFNRTQLYASGALTLGELLDRIPGASTARTGWLTDVQVTSFAGAMGRVRVFVDGVEWDALDPRGGGVTNLGLLQLWPYEEAVVERAGDELRVHLRSWRDNRTAPLTRVDVLTGDREGNVFRGYFAQRFSNGGGLQAVFSNASTRDVRSATAGDGNNIGFNLRGGWSNGRWSFDGWAHRAGGERRPTSRASGLPTLAGDRPQVTVAYLRAGFRDPDSAGVFGQFIVASLGFRESPASNNLSRIQPVTPDTTRLDLREASRLQYIATTGWRRGAFTTSFTARVRAFDGTTPVSPLVRMGYDTPRLGVSLWAETARPDSARRVDAQVRVLPLTRVALAGAWSSATRTVAGQQVATGAMRAEAAVRLRGSLWVGGGVLSRDSAISRAALSLDTTYVTQALSPAQGTFVQLRGDLFRDLKVDAWVIAWRDAANQFYLPKVQAHSRLYIESDWTTRFPKRQFGFLGAVIHEYRDPVRFPTGTGVQTTGIMRNLSTLVEFRLLNAYVSWRFTNTLRLDFDTAPGYILPRGVNLYGIRWEFRG